MWAGHKCICWRSGEGGTTLLACGHVHQPGYLWAVIKGFYEGIINYTASLVARMVKSLLAMRETWVRSQHQEDPLEKGMATHFSIPAWRIPWTEEPRGLQSVGSQRVGRADYEQCLPREETSSYCEEGSRTPILNFSSASIRARSSLPTLILYLPMT